MKFFVVALCIAGALAHPSGDYGHYHGEKEAIRIESFPSTTIVPDAPKYSHDAAVVMTKSGSYNIQADSPATKSGLLRLNVDSDNAGTYRMDLQSGDGTVKSESGSLKNLGSPQGPVVVKDGSFAWTSPEGLRFLTTYHADENGFVAKGDHLPTSPPIPEEIRKSLLLPRVNTDYSASSYGYTPPARIVVADTPMATYGYNGASTFKFGPAAIVRHHLSSDNLGSYRLDVQSSDGTVKSETGSLKNLGNPEGPAAVKDGSFAWTSPEGLRFLTTYHADENGFVAKGDHLPTSPPIPEEIKKSLLLPRVNTDYSPSSYGYTPPAIIPAPADPPMNNYGYGAPSIRVETIPAKPHY